jgi:phosphoserine phosphatase
MDLVATLVSPEKIKGVNQDVIDRALSVLEPAGDVHSVEDGVAVDIVVFQKDRKAQGLTHALQSVLNDFPVDCVVQPLAHRRKKLLLCDMDSTMIEQECIDELAAECGIKEHIAAITEKAMRGEIDFEPALRERVALLKNLEDKMIDKVLKTQITLTPGGRALVQTMAAHQATCVLVSGGFTRFTHVIADKLGFHHHHANELLIENGVLTGKVKEPILGKQAKLDTLLAYRDKLGLREEDTLCVGDGANDLAMIQAAGLGIAYHAKPKVAMAAHACLNHCDLSALLYVQGYTKEVFVE